MYSECSRAKATAGNYQRMQSAPILPNYLGLPFRILVSPFVHFDPENRLTDIMMFNSRNLGALIVDEDPHVKSWEDGQYNIMNMSVEETQGLPSLPASCSTYPVSSSSTATPASRARAGRPETTPLWPPSTLRRLRPGVASYVAGFAVVFNGAVLKILDVPGACGRFSGLGAAIMHRAEDLQEVIPELITPSLKAVREDLSGLNNRLETLESRLEMFESKLENRMEAFASKLERRLERR